MQSYDDILKTVTEILQKDFDCPADKLVPEARLVEDLDLDSIDAIDLVVRLQNLTNLKVDAEDFKQIRTLHDVVSTIERLLRDSQAGTTAQS